MHKYYDKVNERLVYINKKADEKYWDAHWNDNINFKTYVAKKNMFVSKTTKKYLPIGSKIIEGGCGKGQNVFTLQSDGYDAYGIDYAEETVKKINQEFPDLKIVFGDVNKLNYNDGFFNGYWSLGVIEHFWFGFDSIMSEMNRVLKKDGILFLTVPTMSPLRRIKSLLNLYPHIESSNLSIDDFFQFAISSKSIVRAFQDNGFAIVKIVGVDSVKGLKDEIKCLRKPLQYCYDSNIFYCKIIKKIINIVFKEISQHTNLYVFRKQ